MGGGHRLQTGDPFAYMPPITYKLLANGEGIIMPVLNVKKQKNKLFYKFVTEKSPITKALIEISVSKITSGNPNSAVL